MFDRRENAQFGQSYARQREELVRRAKRRVKKDLYEKLQYMQIQHFLLHCKFIYLSKKLLVFVKNGTLGKTGTGKSKVKNTLW